MSIHVQPLGQCWLCNTNTALDIIRRKFLGALFYFLFLPVAKLTFPYNAPDPDVKTSCAQTGAAVCDAFPSCVARDHTSLPWLFIKEAVG